MADRTLDQQCTVTRPGLSYVSSGFAVELLVNLVSHPLGNNAPGYHADEPAIYKGKPIEIPQDADMGIVPQHIRGSVGYFETKVMQSSAFDYCLACSKPIVEDFVKDKRAMVTKAVNDPEYLQVASGIQEMMLDGSDDDMGGIIIIED